MKKLSFLLWVIIGLSISSFAASQTDPVLIKIGDYTVKQSEFAEVYRKNNLEMVVADPKSVEEYLELFINFKLKVLEAESLGLDTNTAFINELAEYREQLARPYFYDQEVSDKLLEEAFERMQYDVRASHILISVDEHAPPADTLEAYNRIMEIYRRIEAGESFSEVASAESEDPSARNRAATANRPAFRGNAGDLGYFTVLNMVYEFETAAYNTPVGEVSMPVRSPFGYHLIKVTDRLPAMGRVQAAHIMVNSPTGTPGPEAEKHKMKINELHQRLVNGEDFGALAAEFSDDGASARRNGELPQFTSNRMVPEFIKVISDLKNPGDFSQPVKTDFGWHIVRLIEKTAPGTFEEEFFELKNRISRDARSKLSREVVLTRLKNEYGFKETEERLTDFYDVVDNSIFEAKWDVSKASDLTAELFNFAGKSFTQQDFANYLAQTQGMRTPEGIVPYVRNMYNNWQENSLIDYEDSMLEQKYPEFKSIMKEYHDGILLFELTDKLVWSRAVEDTTGLKQFLADHQDEYMWGERLHATIYLCKDSKTAARTRKAVQKAARNGNGFQQVVEEMNTQSQTEVSAREGKFEKEEEPIIDSIAWKKGLGKPFNWNDRVALVNVHELLPPQPKQIDEIRGMLIADYQNYLEKQWVQELRTKYQVQIDQNVLSQIVF